MTAVERGRTSGKEPSLSVTLLNMKVGDRILSIKTQPISLKCEASKGTRKVVGVAAAPVPSSRRLFQPKPRNRSPWLCRSTWRS